VIVDHPSARRPFVRIRGDPGSSKEMKCTSAW
jgi:hypothetical protein